MRLQTTKKRGSPALWLVMATVLTVVVACTPSGARALLEGDSLLRKGKPKEAIVELKKATTLLPQADRWKAWNHLGLAHQQQGDLSAAEDAFKKALKLEVHRPARVNVVRFNLGRLYLQTGRPAEAMNLLGTYHQLAQPTFASRYWLGVAHRRAGYPRWAITNLLAAVKLNQRSPAAHNQLGLAQLAVGQSADALASFTNALALNPKHGSALLNLAISQHRLPNQSLQEALHLYQRYLALKPRPANWTEVRGVADGLLDQLRPPPVASTNSPPVVAATNTPSTTLPVLPPLRQSNITVRVNVPLRGHTNKLPALPPSTPVSTNSPPPVTQVARVPVPPVPTKPEVRPTPPPLPSPPPRTNSTIAARVASSATIEVGSNLKHIPRYPYRKPGRPDEGDRGKAAGHFKQALHAHRINELERAIEGYEKAIQADPSLQQAHGNLALARYQRGQRVEALEAYETALALNPLYHDARFNMAITLNQGGFSIDAANELLRLLEDQPEHQGAHQLLADVYWRHLKQPAKARGHYLKLLALNPNHAQATAIRQWLAAHP